jgi:hypothetical protein
MFLWRACPRHLLNCLPILIIGLTSSISADDAPAPAQPDATKYTLKYKFQPGETIRSQIWHRVNLETTIEGTTQTAETISGSIKIWRVTAVDPQGQISFEHSVESVDMRQKVSGRQEITYNSQTDKKPPPGYEMVADSLGKTLTIVTIDPSGKIVKRIDKRSNPPADGQNSQMTVPLPSGPVAIGESWNVPNQLTITMPELESKVIDTRQHYTLEKVSHGVATITVATQVLTPVTNPKIESQLIQRLTEGSIRFNIEAGRVLSQQLDLDKRVLGFNGNNSSLHYLGSFTEEYLPPTPKTAAKPAAKK